jgi:hypothetical protein
LFSKGEFMNIIKHLSKLYEEDSYVRAYLDGVALQLKKGVLPIPAFLLETERLKNFFSTKPVPVVAAVPKTRRKRSTTVPLVEGTGTTASAVPTTEPVKRRPGRPRKEETAPTAAAPLENGSIPAEEQAQVVKVTDPEGSIIAKTSGRGGSRKKKEESLPLVPEVNPLPTTAEPPLTAAEVVAAE